MNRKEMEGRIVGFSISVSEWITSLRKHPIIYHLKDQLIRSATSASLNYGEAQSAESRKDFIHKINIVLKELRETQINLDMMSRIKNFSEDKTLHDLKRENDELIAIFYSMLKTAKKNLINYED